MDLERTPLPGVVVVRPRRLPDERGYFARTWDPEVFRAHGLNPALAQCSTSFSAREGTLRGMHYQAAPHEEAKLVRCTRGAIYDVALDLRPESPAFRHWFGVELTEENGLALYVPEGCAHGFLTRVDASEVLYLISTPYAPHAARGVRWDDPAFGIAWPGEVRVLHERDATYPDFRP